MFIVADIQEEGILRFDFCKNHLAEWRWAENELQLVAKNRECISKPDIGREAKITTRRVVIVELAG